MRYRFNVVKPTIFHDLAYSKAVLLGVAGPRLGGISVMQPQGSAGRLWILAFQRGPSQDTSFSDGISIVEVPIVGIWYHLALQLHHISMTLEPLCDHIFGWDRPCRPGMEIQEAHESIASNFSARTVLVGPK